VNSLPLVLSVREAESTDVLALLNLYGSLHPEDEALSPVQARRSLELIKQYPGSAVLLGFCDEIAVSTCTLIVIPNLTRGGSPYALIENVITSPRFRRNGFGKSMLNTAVTLAWEAHCYKVMLLTGAKDAGVLNFYSDAGFEQSKTGFQVRRQPT
jgi:GNAT superfamily N-acetyltransferase